MPDEAYVKIPQELYRQLQVLAEYNEATVIEIIQALVENVTNDV